MRSMTEITRIAARRKGGNTALEGLLPRPLPPGKIRKITDDRFLSAMTQCVFQAGFNWRIIENKWPRFEEVFEGFDIYRWCMMSDDDLDSLLKTEGIVRNLAKLRSVRDNAMFLVNIADTHGSAGNYFSDWKAPDYCRKLRELQKGGSRLGGKTGQVFLRRMGIDTLVFTPDVLKALHREGVVDRMPGSNRDWESLQLAIDKWQGESGRSLNEISQILAFSID